MTCSVFSPALKYPRSPFERNQQLLFSYYYYIIDYKFLILYCFLSLWSCKISDDFQQRLLMISRMLNQFHDLIRIFFFYLKQCLHLGKDYYAKHNRFNVIKLQKAICHIQILLQMKRLLRLVKESLPFLAAVQPLPSSFFIFPSSSFFCFSPVCFSVGTDLLILKGQY